MTSTLHDYSFLPWLRLGIANQIQTAHLDGSVKLRASVTVSLDATGDKIGGGSKADPVNRPVALYGPGDIVGLDRRNIVRMEPRHWITNFEPNYLPHIEFYDEDLPWRYTPAAPDGTGRLRPWITLVVLTEDEFDDGQNMQGKPLPYIEVSDFAGFPKQDELWAWAHVHVNRSLAADEDEFVSDDMAAVIPKLQAVLGENPDLAYSRLLCPRRLAPNTGYHAFVIPTFEPGRRAGLGLDLGDVVATASSWEEPGRPAPGSFPYYHRWYFATGATGDFESLVRLLVPKPVDRRVGFRDMDVLDPGSDVAPLDTPGLGGVLRLGGALQPPPLPTPPPPPPNPFETWDSDFPRPLQTDLAALVNLPDDYQATGDPDPIIAPPLYGTWHALTQRVLKKRDGSDLDRNQNWIHRLNLDPRFRVAAGFGTRIIQDNQERYMDAAWGQVGEVLEAQKRIRQGQFSLLTSEVWHQAHLLPTVAVSPQQSLFLIAPLAKRIVVDGLTVDATLRASLVQPTLVSAAMRRVMRPRGRLIRSLPFDADRPPSALLDRVNAGEVSAAPPKVTPPGLNTADDIGEALQPSGVPDAILDLLRRRPWLPLLVLLALLGLALILLLFLMPIAAAVTAVVGVLLFILLRRWRRATEAADAVPIDEQTPESVDDLPKIPDFTITEVGDTRPPTLGATDSLEAVRFKAALRDTFVYIDASAKAGAVVAKVPLQIGRIVDEGMKAVTPRQTIPKRVMAGVRLPPRIIGGIVAAPADVFVEPMAYPVIDEPMYKPLEKKSSELFLPNINLIENNSITLLQTNQRFIESYMVGLNHEFARELLWREYPTDQRGSPFRQFWDVSSFFAGQTLTEEEVLALKEELRDIPPIHLWSLNNELGDHDHREEGRDNEEELVLAIRGELLKRYPNAVIYAHRACWQRKVVTEADEDKHPCERSGEVDVKVERRLVGLSAAEQANPPKSKVKTPLYGAEVDPDIRFFGFDLTAEEARGGTGENEGDEAGWFFVIQERPGEPRFGLDLDQAPALNTWNDLSWPVVQPGGESIEIATGPALLKVADPGVADEKFVQFSDDQAIVWDRAKMTSAELAYIFFQAPVMVAVHASEMLPK